ncbi:DUF4329 domain-containing protein [Myxococcota bacterium]
MYTIQESRDVHDSGIAVAEWSCRFLVFAVLLIPGCAFEVGEQGTEAEEVAGATSALYDSADQTTTARYAMRQAQAMTVATGNQYEYCGLIVRKANGQYRAGYPTTSLRQTYCEAGITLYSGETVSGYYHTHPRGVVPYFSPEDFDASRKTGRMYYVAGSDGCGYRYDPDTNTAWHLGCPFL